MRLKEIDSLRGIAAILVVLFHYFTVYDAEYTHRFSVPGIFQYGFYAVELFFIISGFVIYLTVRNSNSISRFAISRFIRLFPVYWMCAALTFGAVCLFPLLEFRNTSWGEFIVNLSMVAGLFKHKLVDPSYWSLLIELMFYIQMGLLMVTGQLTKVRWWLALWLLCLVVYTGFYQLPVVGALFNLRYGALFVAGICFYRIKMDPDDRMWIDVVLLVCSFFVNLYVLSDLVYHIYAMLIIYLVFGWVVFFSPRILNNWVLKFLGTISYPLYLIHQNVGFVVLNGLRSIGITNVSCVLIAILIVIVIAWLIHAYFEKPVMKILKDAWLSSKNIG